MKSLTDYADCAGCASKFQAADLDLILEGLPRAHVDDRVLVDFGTADDAGVYRWSDESALVQTVDFFTPIVDDPYVFGQIAAANSLSDVYAMGGEPRTALAIAALPKDGPAPDVVRFGYSITGHVHAKRVFTNAGAQAGDVLILTKAIGPASSLEPLSLGVQPKRTFLDQLVAAGVPAMAVGNVQTRESDGTLVHLQ